MNQENKTIFIAIGAYNESFLEQTVRNCIKNAKHPSRLRFGIYSHNNDGVTPSFPDLENVKVITSQYPTLLGVCPSRMGALFLYDQEDYYLQIDAHMLFQKDWDTILLHSYENISTKERCNHPIITTYVPWWATDEEKNILFYSPVSDAKSGGMSYVKDSYKDAPVPMQSTFEVDWNKHDYFEHYGLSAHFLFTRGSFVRDILPDIDFTFYGEEPTTALRAWTRGYRIFTIPDPIVWHFNKGYGVNYEYDRWVTVGDEALYKHFIRKEGYSHKKAKQILTGEITGYWGAPEIKDLHRFEEMSGFSFKEFYRNLESLTEET